MRIPSISYETRCVVKAGNPTALDLLRDILVSSGIDLTQIIETDHLLDKYVSIYFSSLSKAKSLQKQLRQAKLKRVSIRLINHKRKEWESKWKNDFKAFNLSPRFRIVPDWQKEKKGTRKTVIKLGGGLAFGTGLHPTTKFVAGFIEKKEGKFRSFLDVGTGTGLLTIVALHCKAEDVKAVDISKDAVKVARKNFKLNGFNSIDVSSTPLQKLPLKPRYDFVAANLITDVLVSNKKKLVQLVKPGGYLAVSGISIANYSYFRKYFISKQIRCIKKERAEGWNALLFKRIK